MYLNSLIKKTYLFICDSTKYYVHFSGEYLIVAMTIDRFVAIQFPIKSRKWREPKYALIISAVVFLLVMIYASAYLHMATLVGDGTCTGKLYNIP